MATKVLIVDDHPAVRDGLAVRIASQPDMEVCGEAADTDQAVKLLEATAPTWLSWTSNWKPATGWTSSSG